MSRMRHFGAGRPSCNCGFCDRFPVMRNWKKIGWIGLVVFGLALALIFAAFLRAGRSTARASSWNSHAIEGTLSGVRVREVDASHAAVVFSFDLDNRTGTDYRLASGSNVVIMSRLQPNGSLTAAPQASFDSAAFVPANNRTRISIEISHPFDWPTQRDTSADRQLRQFVADQVAGLQAFVLFDQANRYQIELATTSPQFQQTPASNGQN
jgi:hypothetical protein